jgi:hypothetical protein
MLTPEQCSFINTEIIPTTFFPKNRTNTNESNPRVLWKKNKIKIEKGEKKKGSHFFYRHEVSFRLPSFKKKKDSRKYICHRSRTGSFRKNWHRSLNSRTRSCNIILHFLRTCPHLCTKGKTNSFRKTPPLVMPNYQIAQRVNSSKKISPTVSPIRYGTGSPPAGEAPNSILHGPHPPSMLWCHAIISPHPPWAWAGGTHVLPWPIGAWHRISDILLAHQLATLVIANIFYPFVIGSLLCQVTPKNLHPLSESYFSDLMFYQLCNLLCVWSEQTTEYRA